jgi:hypothetical protein
MEIVKSRYGLERSIERINFKKVRVMGESQFVRKSSGKDSNKTTMFDFEGGPCYTVGGKLNFEKLQWRIVGIEPKESGYKDLYECVLHIEPIFPNERA